MISEVVERRAVFSPIVEEEEKKEIPATSLLTNSVNKVRLLLIVRSCRLEE